MANSRNSGLRRRRQSKPGIVDVAAAAAVSHITVSRVIHGSSSVKPETRERVIAVMKRLGYAPNSAARALVTGRSHTIGIITFNTALYGPAAALQGLERAAAEEGFFLAIASLDELSPAGLERAVDRLRQQSVAGIVVVSPQAALAESLSILPRDTPTVALWGAPDGTLPVIMSGEEEGALMATQHLLLLGHRRVHHIAGPAGRFGAEARICGWRRALEAAQRPVPEPPQGDWSARSGYEIAHELLQNADVTAIFVGSDQMALGVYRAAAESKRRIPDDLSIVGFDDIPEAAFYAPPLTTIRQDFAALGQAAFRKLFAMMSDGEGFDLDDPAPVELVVRASTSSF